MEHLGNSCGDGSNWSDTDRQLYDYSRSLCNDDLSKNGLLGHCAQFGSWRMI